MDYQKAFDAVPHGRLLKNYGIKISIISWVESFLSYIQKAKSASKWQILRMDASNLWDSTRFCTWANTFLIFINDLKKLKLPTLAYRMIR